MKLYLSGPIASEPDYRKLFELAAQTLRNLGHEPVNPVDVPADHAGPCGYGYPAGQGSPHTSACYMRGDLRALLDCEGIVLLRGWEGSVGARTELLMARACGMRVRETIYAGRHPKPLGLQDVTHLTMPLTLDHLYGVDR